jgi:hypothetical protein
MRIIDQNMRLFLLVKYFFLTIKSIPKKIIEQEIQPPNICIKLPMLSIN